MATFPFLSDQWILETRALREKYRSEAAASGQIMAAKINLVVTDVPANARPDGDRVEAHLDTSSGEPEIELGHLADAEVTVTADYELTRSIFVEGNVGKAMEAMQLGRIKVDGDMFKLMGLATLNANPAAYNLAKEIQAITE